jgi:hypothetical protein
MNTVVPRSFAFNLLLMVGASLFGGMTSDAQECQPAPSWIFRPSTFTHDRETGARVAQYERIAPVEGLDDPRLYTSGYRRTRTTLRGADGSIDSTYQVQSWGNGRGGIDAEWERFHDAWRQSYISGGAYSGYAAPYGGGFYGQGPYGYPYQGYGYPGPWGYAPAIPYGGPHGLPAGGAVPPWGSPQP